ncbi:NAD(P)-binding domain-containing protein [Undibacterium sp. 5I1]|uniref:NAD(P)-binding domain-containing protein n=2 Tax=Undibacterium TaxID=401469 RepID=UPI002AB557F9|nr:MULTISPECIES: NAD(P)-binding domain-containing protein [unclassified Undibacterium]MDY7540658.1 NAD(P)-binding domain-containing protein [Undibacterium sp. 5I1]MEB0232391.1 NAD(P)-binding domain-containing protein [Undibacterium sp. 10I3]MEB0259558.1 NAD(P)-binding domain-containing protein [Undibacterium sp. 5I1]
MQLGMIGLGRMGSDMALRLIQKDHRCVVFDIQSATVEKLQRQGAVAADSIATLVSQLEQPRVIWLMLPAGLVDQELASLTPLLDIGDIIIDGGNSYYRDDIQRSTALSSRGIHYVDVGTSGGVFGLERGYCLMIGGQSGIVNYLSPIFESLAPGAASHDTANDRTKNGISEEVAINNEKTKVQPSVAVYIADHMVLAIS